jgi:hypothetical protein
MHVPPTTDVDHRQTHRIKQPTTPTARQRLYPGAKNAPGIYQRIINLMPPHDLYVELFAGDAAIYRRKRPARENILVELDKHTFIHLLHSAPGYPTIINDDAISWLRSQTLPELALIYCDPPYQLSTRAEKPRYKHEMSDDRHEELLQLLNRTEHRVILSGRRSTLYDRLLRRWHRVDFEAHTRRGMRPESLWLNYTPPAVPAELTYLGATYRERERLKRKAARWRAKWRALQLPERALIMQALLEESSPQPAKGSGS